MWKIATVTLEEVFVKTAKHLGFATLVNCSLGRLPLAVARGVLGFVPVPGVLPIPIPAQLDAPTCWAQAWAEVVLSHQQ